MKKSIWVLVSVILALAAVITNASGQENGEMSPFKVIGVGFAHADDRYHLFYDTVDANVAGYTMAYAYSQDGLHWTRPDLGSAGLPDAEAPNLLNIPKGPAGSWNNQMMCSGGVLPLPDKWRLWVAGYRKDAEGDLYAQMTLFESPDPIQWNMVVDRPVVPNGPEGTFDHGFTRVPCVITEDNTFRMYYTAGDGHGGWFIGYAESEDGLDWAKPRLGTCEYAGSKDNNIVLGDDPARRESRVCHPWVFKDDDIYRMYYSVGVGGGYSIGMATSTDGLHWVKNPEVEILRRGPKGSFDYWYAAIPKVVRDEHGYKMWYTGYNGGPTHVEAPSWYALGYATSSDGIHWKKHQRSPIFGENVSHSDKATRETIRKSSQGSTAKSQEEFIEVRNPKTLGVDRLPAERVTLGNAYKPCVAALPDGELMLVCETGGKGYIYPWIFRSTDGGRSWPVETVRKDVLGREPYFTVLKDGTLFMTGLFPDYDVRNTLGWNPSVLHRSHDRGHTWTTVWMGEDMLDPPETRGRYAGNQTCNTRNILEMADGSLLVGLSVYRRPRDVIWRSTDGGNTWPEKYPSRIEGLDENYPYGGFQESVLWQARSGKLFMVSRRHHRYLTIPGEPVPKLKEWDHANGMILYSSTDVGRTWERVGRFGDYGRHYPAVLRLADGRLLLTFTVRDLDPPLGVRAVLGVEHEDGLQFDFEHDVIMLDTKTPLGQESGGGFGPTVQLTDGTLVSSYSCLGRVEVVRWRLPE